MLKNVQWLMRLFVGVSIFNFSAVANASKPNIVLLFADDAGYADFGFHGSQELRTPHLDQLAKEGVRFSQGYVSDPTCGPSRAGLITGRYQQRFGFEENNVPGYMSAHSAQLGDDMGLPLTEKTIADHLKSLGYRTALFGKWHLGGADRFHPTRRGFDEFYGFRGGDRSYFAFPDAENQALRRLERGFGQYEEHEGYLTDKLAEEASAFIRRNQDQPFFAFVSFNAVHTPMDATEGDLAEFPQLTGDRKTVAAMTLAMDRASGKILDTLDQLGLTENTLVIFTNDNGGPTDKNASRNDPLAGTKSNHLEGGLRVPFVARWPAQLGKASVFDDPVSTLDLLPTFLAAAGSEKIPEGLDGVNLLPYLSGAADGVPHQTLYWKKENRAAIRDGDWKLIRFPDRPAELYQLNDDISEQHNLANQHPERVRELFRKLFEWELTLTRPRWMLKREFEKYDLDRMDRYRKPRSSAALAPFSDRNNIGGWVLNDALTDEFDGTVLDRRKWRVQGEDGIYVNWKGRAPSQFAPHNVRLEDGYLKLSTRWEPDFEFASGLQAGNPYGIYNDQPMPVTTAGVISRQRFFLGYVETRSRAADAAITSSFWSLGFESEIDFYEQMGRPAKAGNIRDNDFHFSVYDWRPPIVRPNKSFTDTVHLPFRVADGFHIYGCEWGEDYLKFFVDGQLVRTVTREEVGERWTLSNPLEIWFDSEIFEWLGMPTREQLPVDYQVDYVRVWQKPTDNLLNPALFGFEGPLQVDAYRPALHKRWGEPGFRVMEPQISSQAQWGKSHRQHWWIDAASRNQMATVGGHYSRGRKSLRVQSGKQLTLRARSPYGSLSLPAGDLSLTLQVWLPADHEFDHISLSLREPDEEIGTWSLTDLPTQSWVTLKQDFQHSAPSSQRDQMMVSVKALDPGSSQSNSGSAMYIDNIKISSVAKMGVEEQLSL